MTQSTEIDIREIKDFIAAGNVATQKQVADLAITTQKQIADSAIGTQKQITDLREEMRIGFTKLEGQINTVEAKLEGKIDKVDAKYEERTKLGFWGFIFRGSALAVLAAILVIFVKYLFPILPTEIKL